MKSSDCESFNAHVAVVFHWRLEEQSVEQRKVVVDDQLRGADDAVDGGTSSGTQSDQDVRAQTVLAVRGVVAGRLDLVRVAV